MTHLEEDHQQVFLSAKAAAEKGFKVFMNKAPQDKFNPTVKWEPPYELRKEERMMTEKLIEGLLTEVREVIRIKHEKVTLASCLVEAMIVCVPRSAKERLRNLQRIEVPDVVSHLPITTQLRNWWKLF
eukprot:Lankesteria_metandrocarpae@DN2775_c1_g1_i1.p1